MNQNPKEIRIGSTYTRQYLVRVLGSDGVSIKDQWKFYAADDKAAGSKAATDPRISPGDDYQVSEVKS